MQHMLSDHTLGTYLRSTYVSSNEKKRMLKCYKNVLQRYRLFHIEPFGANIIIRIDGYTLLQKHFNLPEHYFDTIKHRTCSIALQINPNKTVLCLGKSNETKKNQKILLAYTI